jgi:hypothetical protein
MFADWPTIVSSFWYYFPVLVLFLIVFIVVLLAGHFLAKYRNLKDIEEIEGDRRS